MCLARVYGRMALADYEHAYLDVALDNLSASIASGMRDGIEIERLIEDDDSLTDLGRTWVHGYLAGHLAILRGSSTGNPNLRVDDIDELAALAEDHEAEIAAELYA